MLIASNINRPPRSRCRDVAAFEAIIRGTRDPRPNDAGAPPRSMHLAAFMRTSLRLIGVYVR